MLNRNKKGFTITELVIVIAVIAILAAVLIPTFSNVIANAKQSAALQNCSAAVKDYGAIVAQSGDSLSAGMIFVNDGYVFVYYNGTLHYVDQLANLSHVGIDGKFVKGNMDVSPLTSEETYDTITFTIGTNNQVIKVSDLAKNEKHEIANLYFYNVTINNNSLLGYFVLESTSEIVTPLYQTQGAVYSIWFGIAETWSVAGTVVGTVVE